MVEAALLITEPDCVGAGETQAELATDNAARRKGVRSKDLEIMRRNF
jgi:hypothetical protein